MGIHKFRLSDMIPNAWFYKLKKDMGKARNQNSHHPVKKNNPPTSSSLSFSSSASSSSTTTSSSLPSSTATIEKSVIPQQQSKTSQPHLLSHQRKSYYFTRDLNPPPQSTHNSPKSSDTHFPDFPRKSSKQRHSRNRASNRPPPKLATTTPVSGGCLCPATLESVRTNPDSTFEDYPNSAVDTSSDFQSLLPELGFDNDIVIDTDDKSSNTNLGEFNTICKVELPPIITKNPPQDMKEKKKEKNFCIEANKFCKTSKFGERDGLESRHRISTTCREQRNSPVKRPSVSSPGVRLRTNSPRIASCRKIQAHGGRKSWSSNSGPRSRRSGLSESLAVVKSSADPQRDFRESMVEMILENNIKASKELEDLLACYLQLNSDEYHELIIKVFKQIWFDLEDARLN